MKTRNMEELDIPIGFESFLLDESGGSFSSENMANRNKELVLISAPAEFDINKLKGEQFILNGSKLLDDGSRSDSEETSLRWELHSALASSDKHLNILLPSDIQRKHIITDPVSVTLNVVRNLHIPNLKSPKKKKKGTRLPKPVGLKTRWIPYGSDSPGLCEKSTHFTNEVIYHGIDEEIGSEIKQREVNKMMKKNENTESQDIDFNPDSTLLVNEINDTTKCNDNSGNDEVTISIKHQKKKKKKKKLESVVDAYKEPETNAMEQINLHKVNTELENEENVSGKKHKKKSKLPEEIKKEECNGEEGETVLGQSSISENNIQTNMKNENNLIDNNTKKHKKKKEKKTNPQEEKPIEFNVDQSVENSSAQMNTITEVEENANIKKHKKKKKKSVLLEHYDVGDDQKTDESMLSQSSTFEKETVQTIIKNENDYPDDQVTKKQKKKKKKKECQVNEESDVKPEESHLSNPVITETKIIETNIKAEDDPSVGKKKKKKKRRLEENIEVNMAGEVNQTGTSGNEQVIKKEEDETLVEKSDKKHKKKKKKKGESQETITESIEQKPATVLLVENNILQIKTEEDSGFHTENNNNNNDNKRKRKRKKRNSSINEMDKNNIDTKEVAMSAKYDTSEIKTSDILPISDSPITENSKKRARKRKHKAIPTDEIDNKKQKLDTIIDISSTKLKKNTNTGSLKSSSVTCNSDLDSDSEARIFGVVPKRGFSN